MTSPTFNNASGTLSQADRLGRELFAAIDNRVSDLAVLRDLVKKGANIELRDDSGNTPLLYAIMHLQSPAAIQLLDLGAQPNVHSDDGITPLIGASFGQENLALTRKLLDKGALPNDDFYGTKTALMWAAHRGFHDTSVEIATRGGDIMLMSQGTLPMNAIEWANSNNKHRVVQALSRIQERKMAAEEAAQEQARIRSAENAEHDRKQEVAQTFAESLYSHSSIDAPAPATFKRKPPSK